MKTVTTELIDGFKRYELWRTLAWYDIKTRYDRSVLGPFWLAASMGLMILTIGFVYGTIFNMELQHYFPYLTMGFISWALISSFVNEGSGIFMEVAGLIKQMHVPLSVHIARLTMRSVVIYLHNMVIFVVVALIFKVNPGWHLLLEPLGVILVLVNGAWVALLLGALSVRFRDFQHVVASVLQFLFFVTPIMWRPTQLDGTAQFFMTECNPLYHAVNLIRAPMLGESPELLSWLVLSPMALVGWLVTIRFLAARGHRIPFWV